MNLRLSIPAGRMVYLRPSNSFWREQLCSEMDFIDFKRKTISMIFIVVSPKPAVAKQATSDVPKAQAQEEEPVDTVQSAAVREKLKELEAEIEKFRTENAALAKIRKEREEVWEQFFYLFVRRILVYGVTLCAIRTFC